MSNDPLCSICKNRNPAFDSFYYTKLQGLLSPKEHLSKNSRWIIYTVEGIREHVCVRHVIKCISLWVLNLRLHLCGTLAKTEFHSLYERNNNVLNAQWLLIIHLIIWVSALNNFYYILLIIAPPKKTPKHKDTLKSWSCPLSPICLKTKDKNITFIVIFYYEYI